METRPYADVMVGRGVSRRYPHVRGWLDDTEGQMLSEIAAGKDVLELGSFCGLSTLWLAQTAKTVLAVDTFDGRSVPQPGDTLDEFTANTALCGNVTAFVGESTSLLARRPALEHTFDVVFVDAAHDYDNVLLDIGVAVRAVKPGGTIVFHDYDSPWYPDVSRAIADSPLMRGAKLVRREKLLGAFEMGSEDSKSMKVAVGVVSGEMARYADFYDSLMHVRGVTHENVIQARGASVAENRNGIAERALKMGFDAVWYVDDDQIFGPDTLQRLIAADKDIVSGLYVKRQPPFVPQVYDREDERGWVYPKLLAPLTGGIVEVKAVGAGCLLVKRAVFEAMESPIWRLGQIVKDGWCDDVDWCKRARDAGFSVWCDFGLPVGHKFAGTLWPMRRRDGVWVTIMAYGSEMVAEWPAAMDAEDPVGLELPSRPSAKTTPAVILR